MQGLHHSLHGLEADQAALAQAHSLMEIDPVVS